MSADQLEYSVALIRHPDAQDRRWLTLPIGNNGTLGFIFAERLGKESWRECLDREIAWTLNVRRGKDYLISSMARMHLEGERITNASTGTSTIPTYEFYVVDPYGRAGRDVFLQHTNVQWVTSDELLSGKTESGASIDSELTALLRKADLLPKG